MKDLDYHETLQEVREEIARRLERSRVELLNPDFFSSCFQSFTVPLVYGEVRRESGTILKYKGKATRKATRKAAHAIVNRLHSGRYELTFYVA